MLSSSGSSLLRPHSPPPRTRRNDVRRRDCARGGAARRWASPSTAVSHQRDHDYVALRQSRRDDIQNLAEVKASERLEAFLESNGANDSFVHPHARPLDERQKVGCYKTVERVAGPRVDPASTMSHREVRVVLDAMLASTRAAVPRGVRRATHRDMTSRTRGAYGVDAARASSMRLSCRKEHAASPMRGPSA